MGKKQFIIYQKLKKNKLEALFFHKEPQVAIFVKSKRKIPSNNTAKEKSPGSGNFLYIFKTAFKIFLKAYRHSVLDYFHTQNVKSCVVLKLKGNSNIFFY